MKRPRYLNGRVLVRPPGGGVHRYATEVASRLSGCEVVRPRSARLPWSARVWEQTSLLEQTRAGVLLSVAHGGPVRHPRHIVVVHDLLALTMPGSVNPAYARAHRLLLPKLIEAATAVVAPSQTVADQIVERFEPPSGPARVVAPGIADVFGPADRAGAKKGLGLDPGRPVVSALLDPAGRKNSRGVLEVLASIRGERPDVQVVVAGRLGVPAFARRGRASTPDRPRGAIDLGDVSDARLATMYQASDVFVSLSTAEGFGLPPVEAAFSGAAVVCTPVPSILEHGPDAAVTVETGRDALEAALDLLDSAVRRAALADGAAERFGDLRWAITAASLGALMDEVGDR